MALCTGLSFAAWNVRNVKRVVSEVLHTRKDHVSGERAAWGGWGMGADGGWGIGEGKQAGSTRKVRGLLGSGAVVHYL